MKSLTVIQHTSSEHLGWIEDHLEARQIRFRYVRPFQAGSGVPAPASIGDGLALLGGGPWGAAGERDLPTLQEECALARDCLMANRLIIGFGLGAQILALAAEGSATPAPLELRIGAGRRVTPDALNGYLPERFPYAAYMRDWPQPPAYAKVLAVTEDDRPLIFQMGETAFGFACHPGFKRAMAEDLIMEFEEGPDNPAPALQRLQSVGAEIADALVPIMTGLIQSTKLMR